jgi:hypothetical protein
MGISLHNTMMMMMMIGNEEIVRLWASKLLAAKK